MRFLLLGEYSNVHHTLCEALRRAGHDVLLISDGDGWKNYPRDIDLRRRYRGPIGSLLYLSKLLFLLPKMRGFDVVQLINPVFLDVKPRWNRWLTAYLKRHNRLLSLGCMGDDSYVVSRMQEPDFLPYTDFHAYGKKIDHPNNRQRILTWCSDQRESLSHYCAATADLLLAGLYEYYKVYDTEAFRHKLHYLPLPIEVNPQTMDKKRQASDIANSDSTDMSPVRVLLAIQKHRTQMKGTDQIEPLLQRLAQEHPDKIDLHRIESVPFAQYCQEVDEAEVIVDQLYSYTPAMGALEAMSRGKVVITGGEEYELEGQLMKAPVINLRPFRDEENYRILTEILLDRKKIARLSADSQAYVQKYHEADVVAQRYLTILRSSHPDVLPRDSDGSL